MVRRVPYILIHNLLVHREDDVSPSFKIVYDKPYITEFADVYAYVQDFNLARVLHGKVGELQIRLNDAAIHERARTSCRYDPI